MRNLKCPICGSTLFDKEDNGDWTKFLCLKCRCLFSVTKRDLEETRIRIKNETSFKNKIKFNPSRRYEMLEV